MYQRKKPSGLSIELALIAYNTFIQNSILHTKIEAESTCTSSNYHSPFSAQRLRSRFLANCWTRFYLHETWGIPDLFDDRSFLFIHDYAETSPVARYQCGGDATSRMQNNNSIKAPQHRSTLNHIALSYQLSSCTTPIAPEQNPRAHAAVAKACTDCNIRNVTSIVHVFVVEREEDHKTIVKPKSASPTSSTHHHVTRIQSFRFHLLLNSSKGRICEYGRIKAEKGNK